MRFLTYKRLAAGDLDDKVAKVRSAIERDDFKSPDVKRLHVGQDAPGEARRRGSPVADVRAVAGERACLALEVIRN